MKIASQLGGFSNFSPHFSVKAVQSASDQPERHLLSAAAVGNPNRLVIGIIMRVAMLLFVASTVVAADIIPVHDDEHNEVPSSFVLLSSQDTHARDSHTHTHARKPSRRQAKAVILEQSEAGDFDALYNKGRPD